MAGIKHKTRAAGTNIKTSAVWAEDHEIESGAIPTAGLADGSVTTAKLADNAVTSEKIAPDTVLAVDIAPNAVGASELADNAVDTAAIQDNAVTNAKMADNSVNTAELVDNAVTNAKMADNSVNTAELVDNAVTTAKITDLNVTSSKLAEGIGHVCTNYIIYKKDSTYYARNGATGAIDYSGTNETTVVQDVENVVDDTGGIIYLKGFQLPSGVFLSSNVMVIEEYQGIQHIYALDKDLERTPKGTDFVFMKTTIFSYSGSLSGRLQQRNYPSAIYRQTYLKTYFVWEDNAQDIYIKAYNHMTESWGSSYKVADSPHLTDADTPPSIGILPNGKLIVFYGCHSDEPIYYKISQNAGDESSWGEQLNLPVINMGWTYPQVSSFADKLVLVARDSVSSSQTRWMKNTTVNGTTWTGWIDFINFGAGIFPYFTTLKQGKYMITGGSKYTYVSEARENFYFAFSDDEGTTWKKADGTVLTLPLDEAQTLVATSATVTIGLTPVLDELNRPLLSAKKQVNWNDPTMTVKVLQYSSPLGLKGFWVLNDMTDMAKNVLTFHAYAFPEFFIKDGIVQTMERHQTDYRPVLLRRANGYDSRFQEVYHDSEALSYSEVFFPMHVANAYQSKTPIEIFYFVAESASSFLFIAFSSTLER